MDGFPTANFEVNLGRNQARVSLRVWGKNGKPYSQISEMAQADRFPERPRFRGRKIMKSI